MFLNFSKNRIDQETHQDMLKSFYNQSPNKKTKRTRTETKQKLKIGKAEHLWTHNKIFGITI